MYTCGVHLQDRCHRTGQTRSVTVYKLFAADTVDEDIYDMGERNSKLSKPVLQDDRQRQAKQQQPGERVELL
jgi:SNF2 family DNA or RNA helicase